MACVDPVKLPKRALGPGDMSLWGQDRAALAECRDRQKALSSAIDAVMEQGE